jgi:hypothetical protein
MSLRAQVLDAEISAILSIVERLSQVASTLTAAHR